MNDGTPIWQLTVGEFKDLIRTTAVTTLPTEKHAEPGEFVYGISGLASLLKVSKTTAQKIKSSGLLDQAITQVGRQTIIDRKKTLAILQKKRISNF
jgi:hypothetical protein